MPKEPSIKRTGVFFDGQNLYHASKKAYGYTYPNYDPICLAHTLCRMSGWLVKTISFYTGIPSFKRDSYWNRFWSKKLGMLGKKGANIYSRQLRYNKIAIQLESGITNYVYHGEEKGIDVRLAIDAVRMARRNEYDVCLLFSQDQDLSEVADEIRSISIEQNRWIKVASAFPLSSSSTNRRGINNTDWIPFEKSLYDTCIDPLDYRPRS